MNSLINYIWQNQLIDRENLETTTGDSLCIIDCGTPDKERGHIYSNAKVRIGDKLWSGNIALHNNSSDWEKEIHKEPGCYSNVILHVTLNNDCEALRAHGETINQLTVKCPSGLEEEFMLVKRQGYNLPCGNTISKLADIHLHSYLSRMLAERMEEKTTLIEKIFKQCNENWETALFKTLVRSFGFGIQSWVFEEWAAILDTHALGKHRDNTMQVEAIFFGQAGLLDEESIPYYYRDEAMRSDYYKNLVKEYKFLTAKFDLKKLDYRMWGNGNTSPHCRIARLAAIFRTQRFTMSSIAECHTTAEYRKLLIAPLEGYWSNHICFGGVEKCNNGDMREKQLDILIINSIVPILYVYGKHRKDERYCSKAEDILHQMKCEENYVVRQWREKGVCIDCAADSQALLQLNHNYCQKHNCINCQFAYHYIKGRIAEC